MKVESIKQFIHESVENIDDKDFLLEIQNLLAQKYVQKKIKLPQYVKQRIEKAERQIREGKFLTDKEANRLVENWLKEKSG